MLFRSASVTAMRPRRRWWVRAMEARTTIGAASQVGIEAAEINSIAGGIARLNKAITAEFP